MLKRDEAQHPNSCWTKAHDDELVFVLLARDVAAPHAIREWARTRVQFGKNKPDDPQILEAYHCAAEMEREQAANRSTYRSPKKK